MTAYELARRYVGIKERAGERHHPLIQWWFELSRYGVGTSDETPWCSAFVNGITWELGLPRSQSAAARSWLNIGDPIELKDAVPGNDIVVLERGSGGHVGFYVSHDDANVTLLGGNQSNAVTVQPFPLGRILGVRRLS